VSLRSPAVQLLALLGAFVAGTVLAELFGAVNLGTSLTFGTIAFMLLLVFLLTKR
jgi:hypothetical protein